MGAGVVFPPRHLGQRLCHRASRALLCHAFQTLSAREVVAETIDTGRAARVLEKLWFRREGAQPVESPAGGRTLLYQYALRAKDWERENRNGAGKFQRRFSLPC